MAIALRRHGILVVADQEDLQHLAAAIRSLPADARKLWAETLPDLPRRKLRTAGPTALADVDSLAGFAASGFDGAVAVTFVRDALALAVAVPAGAAAAMRASGTEVVRAAFSGESEHFQAVETLSTRDICKGDDRATVWHNRFEPLASSAPVVTILDRYAGTNFLSARSSGRLSGLEWFLARLDACGTRGVHLITGSSLKEEQRLIAELKTARSALTGGLQSLTLTAARDAAFKQHAHARHIRFGRHAVVVDKGIGIFGDALSKQNHPCHLCNHREAQERERLVEQHAPARSRRHPI